MASVKKKAGYRLFRVAQDLRALKTLGNTDNDNAVLEELARQVEALNQVLESFDKRAGKEPNVFL